MLQYTCCRTDEDEGEVGGPSGAALGLSPEEADLRAKAEGALANEVGLTIIELMDCTSLYSHSMLLLFSRVALCSVEHCVIRSVNPYCIELSSYGVVLYCREFLLSITCLTLLNCV